MIDPLYTNDDSAPQAPPKPTPQSLVAVAAGGLLRVIVMPFTQVFRFDSIRFDFVDCTRVMLVNFLPCAALICLFQCRVFLLALR